ncbi:PspA/IM30 family protein [Haloimpatiens sp. FM7315]|uniref:PspA/IM30 family protein n=1 Tax=Haloimpatiens sp. FM7315 TaxID=3298609 RepID=UPI0035A27E00
MSVFKRISNMFRAKVNGALDEMENPIELLDQKIRDMEESLNKAKISSAQILGNVHELKQKINKLKLESEDYESKIKIALKANNEALAKKALEKKLESDKSLDSINKSYIEAKTKADTIKEKLIELQKEIEKTRSYRDEAAARYNNAEATEKVNEILSNVDTKYNKINIDDIERKIERKEAIAEGLGELKTDTSLQDEFEELEKKVNLEDELLKYKEDLNK